ncbi:MAG: tellurite resistance TerB family protein [Cyanobacteria bacterium J06623_4]
MIVNNGGVAVVLRFFDVGARDGEMGILNQVFGSPSDAKIAMNSAEAFAAICLVAIASDGYLSESEELEMNMCLSRMQLFKDATEESLARMKAYLVDGIKKHGPNELIKSAKVALPPNLAPTAFAIAVDLIFADGTVSREEQVFVDDLRRLLMISDELAIKVVEVMTIKNQG